MQKARLGEAIVYPVAQYSGIPPLPAAASVDPSVYRGPTEESNWVIYNRLLVGAYPSSQHDPTNTAIITSLLRLGVTTFVCLQQEYQHEGVTEAEWRSGAKLRPYIFDAIKIVDSLPASYFPSGKITGLDFVHFAIQDCAIAHDSSVLQLARDLCARLANGEVLYVVRLVCSCPLNPHTPCFVASPPIPPQANTHHSYLAGHTPVPPFRRSTAGEAMVAQAPWFPSCWVSFTARAPCSQCAGCSLYTTYA